MKVELFKVAYQVYLIPTIKITYSKTLHGNYSVALIWLKRGIEFNF
jgi:hypothetical protein